MSNNFQQFSNIPEIFPCYDKQSSPPPPPSPLSPLSSQCLVWTPATVATPAQVRDASGASAYQELRQRQPYLSVGRAAAAVLRHGGQLDAAVEELRSEQSSDEGEEELVQATRGGARILSVARPRLQSPQGSAPVWVGEPPNSRSRGHVLRRIPPHSAAFRRILPLYSYPSCPRAAPMQHCTYPSSRPRGSVYVFTIT